jgi:hypothetical protein
MSETARGRLHKDFPGISSFHFIAFRYSSSSLCISAHPHKNGHTIFKNYRMKTYTLRSAAKNQETNTVWDAFVEYLETVHFESAAEELDKELVGFEYESYKSCYEK